MNRYLRSVGFTQWTSDEVVDKQLEDIQRFRFQYSRPRVIEKSDGSTIYEMRVPIANSLELILMGYIADDGYHIKYHAPSLKTDIVSTTVACQIEEKYISDIYAGLSEDVRLGTALIFHVENSLEYQERRLSQKSLTSKGVRLFGLSVAAKVIMPIEKNISQRVRAVSDNKRYEALMDAAMKGDDYAISTLADHETQVEAAVQTRIKREDVYSIVDSSFIPEGMECDIYYAMGTIVECRQERNIYTHEYVYIILVECNGMHFPVVINVSDLQGQPEVGRRIKGMFWMQGHVEF